MSWMQDEAKDGEVKRYVPASDPLARAVTAIQIMTVREELLARKMEKMPVFEAWKKVIPFKEKAK
jgi:hypothetical protein